MGSTKENGYEGSSYIRYDSSTKQLSVKGKISAKSTVDGKELSQYFNKIAELQNQIWMVLSKRGSMMVCLPWRMPQPSVGRPIMIKKSILATFTTTTDGLKDIPLCQGWKHL